MAPLSYNDAVGPIKGLIKSAPWLNKVQRTGTRPNGQPNWGAFQVRSLTQLKPAMVVLYVANGKAQPIIVMEKPHLWTSGEWVFKVAPLYDPLNTFTLTGHESGLEPNKSGQWHNDFLLDSGYTIPWKTYLGLRSKI